MNACLAANAETVVTIPAMTKEFMPLSDPWRKMQSEMEEPQNFTASELDEQVEKLVRETEELLDISSEEETSPLEVKGNENNPKSLNVVEKVKLDYISTTPVKESADKYDETSEKVSKDVSDNEEEDFGAENIDLIRDDVGVDSTIIDEVETQEPADTSATEITVLEIDSADLPSTNEASTSHMSEKAESEETEYSSKLMRNRLTEIFMFYSKHPKTKKFNPNHFELEPSKFNKMIRDAKLLNKRLSANLVDIIFVKVKNQSDRKISFNQFLKAIDMISETCFPGSEQGKLKVLSRILENIKVEYSLQPEEKVPAVQKIKKSNSSIFDRLSDSKNFTGTQKQKFIQLKNKYP